MVCSRDVCEKPLLKDLCMHKVRMDLRFQVLDFGIFKVSPNLGVLPLLPSFVSQFSTEGIQIDPVTQTSQDETSCLWG